MSDKTAYRLVNNHIENKMQIRLANMIGVPIMRTHRHGMQRKLLNGLENKTNALTSSKRNLNKTLTLFERRVVYAA